MAADKQEKGRCGDPSPLSVCIDYPPLALSPISLTKAPPSPHPHPSLSPSPCRIAYPSHRYPPPRCSFPPSLPLPPQPINGTSPLHTSPFFFCFESSPPLSLSLSVRRTHGGASCHAGLNSPSLCCGLVFETGGEGYLLKVHKTEKTRSPYADPEGPRLDSHD
eukprot:Sspe_Gene.63063::Locus_35821_Transcript_1_1_Confidence_1.000_Length_825::g.63063::m.63063